MSFCLALSISGEAATGSNGCGFVEQQVLEGTGGIGDGIYKKTWSFRRRQRCKSLGGWCRSWRRGFAMIE